MILKLFHEATVIYFLIYIRPTIIITITIMYRQKQENLTPPSTLPNLISRWCRSKNCTCPRVVHKLVTHLSTSVIRLASSYIEGLNRIYMWSHLTHGKQQHKCVEHKKLKFYLPDHQVDIVLEMEIELFLQALDPLI